MMWQISRYHESEWCNACLALPGARRPAAAASRAKETEDEELSTLHRTCSSPFFRTWQFW